MVVVQRVELCPPAWKAGVQPETLHHDMEPPEGFEPVDLSFTKALL